MTYRVELYRGRNYVYSHSLTLISVLRTALESILGYALSDEWISMKLLGEPDYEIASGLPQVLYLTPVCGYALALVKRGDRVVYRHPHRVNELLAEPLRQILLREFPDENYWAFHLSGPGLESLVPERPTPIVEGAISLSSSNRTPTPNLRISRVEEPEPPAASLAQFGLQLADPPQAFVKVLVKRSVVLALQQDLTFSPDVEEGGFLIGRVFADADAPGTYLLEITAALPAEHTGASFLHLTFTGDSFGAAKRELRLRQSDERLLGWYHTHLFAAAETMGLSSIDLELHFTTFRLPWQLAGLVNIDRGQRLLRFYVRQQQTMALCPFWEVP